MNKINAEVFDSDPELASAIIWWLVHLLGGKVVIPADEDFWLENYPRADESQLVLRHEGNQTMLVAERRVWGS